MDATLVQGGEEAETLRGLAFHLRDPQVGTLVKEASLLARTGGFGTSQPHSVPNSTTS